MRIRGSFGIMLLACGLTFVAGCGDDNEGTFGQTPTRTVVVPTAPPTQTSGPQPTSTVVGPTNTPKPTNTPGGVAGEFCGNNVIEDGEECDCGSVCLKGENVGQSCLSDTDCGSGGDCRPVGGQPVETETTGELPGACPDTVPGPCAANCTLETVVPMNFSNLCAADTATPNAKCSPNLANQCGGTCAAGDCRCYAGTGSRVQLTIGPVFLPIQGSQTFRIGKARSSEVTGPPATSGGAPKLLFNPNDIPLALRATDFSFNQIKVPSLSCACVRAFPLDEFGPGLAGVGVISCGDTPLADVSYSQITNHNTGVIPDAQCKAQPGQGTTRVNGTEVGGGSCTAQSPNIGVCQGPAGGGVTWEVGDPCDANVQCNDPHPGICNYLEAPPTFSSETGGRGASVLKTFTSVSSISDGGSCSTDKTFFDKGVDGIPCTDDDRRQLQPLIQFTTTGTASASLANANPPIPGMPVTVPTGTNISIGSKTPCTSNAQCTVARERCFNVANLAQACQTGQTCECRTGCGAQACVAEISGTNYDCSVLLANPVAGLSTGQTIIAFGSFHAASGLDLVATTSFKLEPQSGSSSEEP